MSFPSIRAAIVGSAVASVSLLVGCAASESPSSSQLTSEMQTEGPAKPSQQMQAVLDKLASMNPKPIESLSPEEARKQPAVPDAVKAILTERGMPTQVPVAKVDNRTIPGPGGNLPVRIYTPAGNGPMPVLVYYHGGGWVIAGIDAYDSSARMLANASRHIVVAVGYRKAPENKFPAAHDDAFATYQWVRSNAATFNGDPKRVSVAGESAGGNLAIATSIQARDKGVAMPNYQVLIYPVAGTDLSVQSVKTYANAKPLNEPMLKWFVGHYLANPATEGKTAWMSPVTANLSNLPPTTVITAEIDPLTSGGVTLSENLKKAGNDVRYRHYLGVTHEFFGIGPIVTESVDAVKFASDGLNSVK